MNNFGQFIKQKRKELGFSQQALANACCCHSNRSDICKLEQDKIEWKLRDIEAIANLFSISVSELLKEYEAQI